MRAKAEAIFDTVTDLFNQLSSAERRVLQRRLRASGLLETEELVADRNRLEVATALGVEVADAMAATAFPHPASMPPPERFTDASALTAPETVTEPSDPSVHESSQLSPAPVDAASDGAVVDEPSYAEEDQLYESAEYQSAISGRVVVGAPTDSDAANQPDPHMMSPLPGQAPEAPIRVVFDGGSKGNPGIGYGSYALDWPGLPRQIVQLQFGSNVTNNEAEYDTLIAALEGIISRFTDQDVDLSTAQLDIRGDSELVIKQVRGEYECKSSRMRSRRDRVNELLEEFDDWSLVHHGREQSVRILGH